MWCGAPQQIHFTLNMAGIFYSGMPLEKRFGAGIIALLYVCSGLFGTCVSIIFLPGVTSVGASGSLFGLIGAQWSNVVMNRRNAFARKAWKNLKGLTVRSGTAHTRRWPVVAAVHDTFAAPHAPFWSTSPRITFTRIRSTHTRITPVRPPLSSVHQECRLPLNSTLIIQRSRSPPSH